MVVELVGAPPLGPLFAEARRGVVLRLWFDEVGESADAVGRGDAMARHDHRAGVGATRLADGAWRGAERFGEFTSAATYQSSQRNNLTGVNAKRNIPKICL